MTFWSFIKDKVISLTSGVTPLVTNIEVELDTHESSYEVSIRSFAAVVGTNFSVHVPDKIFVGMTLIGASSMIFQGKKCWATPRYAYDVLVGTAVTVTPGLLHFPIFLSNFPKNTAKNTTKPANSLGLLHFFCNSPGVTTVILVHNKYLWKGCRPGLPVKIHASSCA